MSARERRIGAPLLLRVEEAAALLATSRSSVYRLIRAGYLAPAHVPHVGARLERDAVERFARGWFSRLDSARGRREDAPTTPV